MQSSQTRSKYCAHTNSACQDIKHSWCQQHPACQSDKLDTTKLYEDGGNDVLPMLGKLSNYRTSDAISVVHVPM